MTSGVARVRLATVGVAVLIGCGTSHAKECPPPPVCPAAAPAPDPTVAGVDDSRIGPVHFTTDPFAIRTHATMGSPEGTYSFTERDLRNRWRTVWTFAIRSCVDVGRPAETNSMAQAWKVCRLIWTTTTPDCPPDGSCDPLVMDEGLLSFGRYTSPIARDDGRPVLDNWTASYADNARTTRLLISEDRFVQEAWSADDPTVEVKTARIQRLTP